MMHLFQCPFELKMEARRAQLRLKLKSLAADKDELLHHHQQQQQLSVASCWTSSSVNQLIGVAEDTIDSVTALLDLSDHCSDELLDHAFTVLDLVSLLLLQNSPNCSDAALYTCSAKITSTNRPTCDFIVWFSIAFCVIAYWFVEIWSV